LRKQAGSDGFSFGVRARIFCGENADAPVGELAKVGEDGDVVLVHADKRAKATDRFVGWQGFDGCGAATGVSSVEDGVGVALGFAVFGELKPQETCFLGIDSDVENGTSKLHHSYALLGTCLGPT
jgi:hypothetical protein